MKKSSIHVKNPKMVAAGLNTARRLGFISKEQVEKSLKALEIKGKNPKQVAAGLENWKNMPRCEVCNKVLWGYPRSTNPWYAALIGPKICANCKEISK